MVLGGLWFEHRLLGNRVDPGKPAVTWWQDTTLLHAPLVERQPLAEPREGRDRRFGELEPSTTPRLFGQPQRTARYSRPSGPPPLSIPLGGQTGTPKDPSIGSMPPGLR